MNEKIDKTDILFMLFIILLITALAVAAMVYKGSKTTPKKHEVISIEKVREIEDMSGNIYHKEVSYATKYIIAWKDENGKIHPDQEIPDGYVQIGGKKTYYEEGATTPLHISEEDYKKIKLKTISP